MVHLFMFFVSFFGCCSLDFPGLPAFHIFPNGRVSPLPKMDAIDRLPNDRLAYRPGRSQVWDVANYDYRSFCLHRSLHVMIVIDLSRLEPGEIFVLFGRLCWDSLSLREYRIDYYFSIYVS
jgi:hypothetical protein